MEPRRSYPALLGDRDTCEDSAQLLTVRRSLDSAQENEPDKPPRGYETDELTGVRYDTIEQHSESEYGLSISRTVT